MNALELKNISKKFEDLEILRNLNLEVEPGKILVIFAPSGSGKTVLLRIIAGVEDPDQGSVFFEGRDLTNKSPDKRPIGMASQNFALFPHMNAYENIRSTLEAQKTDNQEIKIKTLAKLLKIDHVLEHSPKELSNGQKQRVALARALIGEPRVLLLDDPLRNIDAKLRFEMQMELPELLRKTESAVIYVTQDYREAMGLADQIAVLIDGVCVQRGIPERIYSRPQNVEVAKLFGEPSINLCQIETKIVNGILGFCLCGIQIPMPSSYQNLPEKNYLVGIRPHAILFRKEHTSYSIPAKLMAVTPMSLKSVLLLSLSDQTEILVSTEENTDGFPEEGYLEFEPEKLLFFDPESGQLIEPEEKKEEDK